jgi:hypothetical protein
VDESQGHIQGQYVFDVVFVTVVVPAEKQEITRIKTV